MKNKHFYILTIIFLLYIRLYESSLGQNYWELTNGPYGGNVKLILINKNGDYFICTNSKLYRSTNKGKDWIMLMDTCYLVVIASTPKGNLLAGDNSNIYRSTDNGNSWKIVYSKGNWTIDVEKIFCASNGEIFAFGGGLYKSTDDGLNWTELNKGAAPLFFIFKDDFWLLSNSVQLFYSTDRGGDWYPTYQLVYTVPTGMIKESNGVLIISTEHNGMFKSIDTAKSWVSINKGLDTLYILSLAMNSKNTIFAGTNGCGIYYSTDLGNNWQHTGLTEGIVNTIVIDSNDNLFAGRDYYGFCYSNDNGKNWTELNNGIRNLILNKMYLNSKGNIFLLGSRIPCIFRTTDNGKTWERKTEGLSDLYFAQTMVENKRNELFLGTWRGIYKSTDNGDTWDKANAGVSTEPYVTSILSLSNGDMLMSDGSVYKSTDYGNSWTWISTAIKMYVGPIAINSNGEFFAGIMHNYGNGAGFYKSTDNGVNWLPSGANGLSISSLLINDNGYIFAGTDSKGVFRSTNDGNTWDTVNNGLKFDSFSTFDILAKDQLGKIYATAYDHIYHTTNNGDSWININHEITGKRIAGILINPDGYLFVSTGSGEVYKSINSVTGVPKDIGSIPEKFSLEQNYPNPFNPSTIIKYQLPVNSFVTLKIYDILGKEIATLVHEKQTAGLHNITWDAKNIPAGIYFYRLQTERYCDVKKMVFIK